MITKTAATWEHSHDSHHTSAMGWRQVIAQAVRDPEELLEILGLPVELLPAAKQAAGQFPLRVPRPFIERMRHGDPADPLLLQVLPLQQEQEHHPEFVDDPVDDASAAVSPGLLHKYHGRVLVITTAACAIHCRYCFRRHFPYQEAQCSDQWPQILDYLQQHPEVNEVILSGGDPLSLSDERLASLVEKLENIPQLDTLRFHTRLPIVVPQRVTKVLLDLLARPRLKSVMVVHCNHPQELDTEVQNSLSKITQTGTQLLNQSVLLKNINDNPEVLAELSRKLFRTGILPYYLHQLDRVNGAVHFDVPESQACSIIEQLQTMLPGYLVPRWVKEIPGMAAKMNIRY